MRSLLGQSRGPLVGFADGPLESARGPDGAPRSFKKVSRRATCRPARRPACSARRCPIRPLVTSARPAHDPAPTISKAPKSNFEVAPGAPGGPRKCAPNRFFQCASRGRRWDVLDIRGCAQGPLVIVWGWGASGLFRTSLGPIGRPPGLTPNLSNIPLAPRSKIRALREASRAIRGACQGPWLAVLGASRGSRAQIARNPPRSAVPPAVKPRASMLRTVTFQRGASPLEYRAAFLQSRCT